MVNIIGYGRLRDLGGLPDLMQSLAGKEGLNRAFHDQDLPVELLTVPDVAVPMRDIIGLYQRAAEITGFRSLGLHASADIDVEQHGLMGEYVLQAPNLLSALKRFSVALPFYESGSSLRIDAVGNELRIGYRTIYQNLVGWRHGGDFTLCVIADVISAYLGDGWRPLRIETCYQKGRWIIDHEDLFKAPVRSDADWVAIVLERETVTKNKNACKPDRLVSLSDLRRLGETLPLDLLDAVTNIIDRCLMNSEYRTRGRGEVAKPWAPDAPAPPR